MTNIVLKLAKRDFVAHTCDERVTSPPSLEGFAGSKNTNTTNTQESADATIVYPVNAVKCEFTWILGLGRDSTSKTVAG